MASRKRTDVRTRVTNIRNRVIEMKMMMPGDLADHPGNWRDHPESQAAPLAGVLRDVGIADVILAWPSARNGGRLTKYDGHLRAKLAPDTPWPTVITDLTDAEADYMIAVLDPIAGMARTDRAALDAILSSVKSEDTAVQQLLQQIAHDNAIPYGGNGAGDPTEPQIDLAAELQKKWKTERGQLWRLGEHRLLCGDCTDAADVLRATNGQKAILFATDPPYLVDYDGTNHPHAFAKPDRNKDWSGSYGNVNWDESGQDDSLYDKFLAIAVEHVLLPNAAWYCWHASRRQAMLEALWEKHGAFVHQQIIWFKDRPVLTRSWYMWQHEPCFFGWKKGEKPPRMTQDNLSGVWEYGTIKPGTKTAHPTSKPVEVFEIPMKQHTLEGDICYEPFCGSGSQIIAGERLHRRVYALEIEPKSVAVALDRWAEMTGQSPELIDSVKVTHERKPVPAANGRRAPARNRKPAPAAKA